MLEPHSDLSECLLGHWIRSHEEDREGQQVYRPATFRFPPARGRTGLEFRPQGEFVYHAIARADGLEPIAGTWAIEPGDRVRITVKSTRVQPFVLQVESCTSERLAVRPVG